MVTGFVDSDILLLFPVNHSKPTWIQLFKRRDKVIH